jgi:hypothetical protein
MFVHRLQMSVGRFASMRADGSRVVRVHCEVDHLAGRDTLDPGLSTIQAQQQSPRWGVVSIDAVIDGAQHIKVGSPPASETTLQVRPPSLDSIKPK